MEKPLQLSKEKLLTTKIDIYESLFIIFLFLCTLSWGQEDVRLSCQVKGNVKSIDITKEESDEIEGDFLVDSFDYNMSIILDKKGRVIKLTSYSEKGKPSDIKETVYDNKNRVVKETVLFLPEKITRKISYSYNDKEKKVLLLPILPTRVINELEER